MRTFGQLDPVVADRSQWTLPRVLALRAQTHASKPFLTVPEDSFSATFAECDQVASEIAGGLSNRGAQPGERIAIMAQNSAQFVLCWFGSAYAGVVEVPINTAYFGEIFEHQIRTTRPRFAAIDPEFADRFARSEAARQSILTVFLFGRSETHAQARHELERAGFEVETFDQLRGRGGHPLAEREPWDLGAILFTSGTTGPSKGVMNPLGQIHFFGEEVVALTQLAEDDVLMSVGPLFHANAQFLSICPALIVGAEVVVRRRFSASNWRAWLRESRATVTNFVGVMMSFVWSQPPARSDTDHHLRCVLTAPTAWPVVAGFAARFNVECITENFGSTETALPILTPYGADRPVGSCGLLLDDWYDVRLVDGETDEIVAAGQPGELLVRAKVPWIMSLGYYGMPDKTVEAQRNLWFHTGDSLRRDGDGWFYFLDRTKDALRRRGENISSYEVEQPILAHPDVADCAVIGVPSEIAGGEDEVMAVIVAAAGTEPTAEDLWAWCDERIPAFARPRFIRFVDDLPRTPTEKVRKAVLREGGIDGSTFDRLTQDEPTRRFN